MSIPKDIVWPASLWMARLASIAAIIPLMLIVFGESGTGPHGLREWLYLAFFPFGFSVGYLAAWRWPLAGGGFSLLCMAASLLVIGRTFGVGAYAIWFVLCLPAIVFVAAGWKLRRSPPPGTLNLNSAI